MGSRIAFEIALILLLLVANGVFAMSEIAIVSARKARLQQRAEEGDAGARAALEIAESPNRFLSTVQIGITLIGIFAGAFGGATLAEEIAARISVIPVLEPYSEAIAVAIVVLATTYLSLIIGELVPKRLALNNAERTAALVARPMQMLSRFTSPVVSLLTVSSDLLLRLLRVQDSDDPSITEEEITLLIQQGIHEGVFEQAEHDIIERVLDLDHRRVSVLMTPRTEIVWLDAAAPLQTSLDRVITGAHSYFPLGDGSLDRLIGLVSAKGILAAMVGGTAPDLRRLQVPPLYIPESVPALNALKMLRQNRQQVALVIDEFGGLAGLIALSDIVQSIVVDLPSAFGGDHEPAIVQRKDGTWLIDGQVAMDEFEKLLDLRPVPVQGRIHYNTVGGLVMDVLGRIPAVSDSFEWRGYRIEVMDMDGHRIDKVLVSKIDGTQDDGA
jgi:putative hemolysin